MSNRFQPIRQEPVFNEKHMCYEAKEFLNTIQASSAEDARKILNTYINSDPEIFAELKGISIARAVIGHIRNGETPTSTLLSLQPETTLPGRLTKGFLKYFGVQKIEDLAGANELNGSEISFESVRYWDDMTNQERGYRTFDIDLPAIRINYTSAVSIASEIA
jgi:hypothetical protein